jgi:hypothetical protein
MPDVCKDPEFNKMKNKITKMVLWLFLGQAIFSANEKHYSREATEQLNYLVDGITDKKWPVFRVRIMHFVKEENASPHTRKDKIPLLHYAILYNDSEVTECLLKNNANPNMADGFGQSALSKADSEEIKQLLIDYNVVEKGAE